MNAIGMHYGFWSHNWDEIQYVPLMEQDLGVLEVKFDHFLPDYLRKILDRIDSQAEANSKYTRARMMV